jgi:branched-chain amino acid transport system substrate-binding protein
MRNIIKGGNSQDILLRGIMKKLLVAILMLITVVSCKDKTNNIGREVSIGEFETGFSTGSDSIDGSLVKHSKKKIGIILPLSSNAVGKAMMDAISLGLNELGNKDLELKIWNLEDVKNDFAGIKRSALDENIKLIIGPLYSEDSLNLAIQLKDTNINILSFSNNPHINEQNLHLLGITPQIQLDNIINYTLADGYSNYFLLLPANNKGRFYAGHLSKILSQSNGQISGVEYYGENMSGSEIACKSILAKIKSSPGKKVLFFSDAKKNMESLIVLLKEHGLDINQDLQLVSTSDIEEVDNHYLAKLRSVKFAAPPLKIRENFRGRFKKQFGYEAPMLASLAYDSIALAVNIAESNFTLEYIEDTRGFYGINGLFRFAQDKALAERNLAILEYSRGSLSEIENYNKTFDE